MHVTYARGSLVVFMKGNWFNLLHGILRMPSMIG